MATPRSACGANFLSNHSPQSFLQGFAGARNILPQGFVDQGLVVPATSFIDLMPEPCQHVVIEPDGDAFLPLGGPIPLDLVYPY